ncbi:type I-MYXAN CRISPR-associated endonuclease Cas4/Cas1 [Corallococcus macrosporus]|uniref:CRISPR-associated endonuclease Cas1 n=1 Tax=Corallococcus macrosporus DSM 14697 TaxID=1189310 RepID=A0A286NVX2_9BACT|nr:type I-MYXAN CRISPR-associated endonuclease Cas1 [Corallococcus macrosporus]ATB51317.1 type I-MYXAN CRISPR-associated endonuclease Cas4/Cas1 [Corallococcus macrosporus DSM 14697]
MNVPVTSPKPDVAEPSIRTHALHALAYCERLFYLEEVEELRVADASVFAGRRLHVQLQEEGERVELELASEALGLHGRVDALRTREGTLVVHEHKRGRHAPGRDAPEAWPSDRLQAGAYALLVEERFPGTPVECRVRYHQTDTTVSFPLDAALRRDVAAAVSRARLLRASRERPPVTPEERKCAKCSLAPVCLPEEERSGAGEERPRLFPEDDVRLVLHVTTPGARVGKSSEQLVVTPPDGEGEPTRQPGRMVSALIAHGAVQVSAQALAYCVENDIGVHWFTSGGRYLGGLTGGAGSVHRRLRQFEALRQEAVCLGLARRLVAAKLEGQLRFLMRASRGDTESRKVLASAVRDLRELLPKCAEAPSLEVLLGLEGAGAARYFGALPYLQGEDVDARLRFDGRNRRPPRDRFNAALGFLYGLVHREVEAAIRAVGLDVAFGFYHQPRGSAGPLGLDVMELFRVPLADMPLVASVNRRAWDADADFEVTSEHVWLSKTGRAKAIELYERRKRETWKHNVLGYSLSYARLVELEVRLLEKEWTGKPGLFATFRLR